MRTKRTRIEDTPEALGEEIEFWKTCFSRTKIDAFHWKALFENVNGKDAEEFKKEWDRLIKVERLAKDTLILFPDRVSLELKRILEDPK